jgi:predicted dehydrogenase
MTVRIGLLTTANINRALLGTRTDDAPYAFEAVGSRDLARAEAYAREWGLSRAHGSYEELLDDDELDAVYVALPNAFHFEWTMGALAAGKHVLCEKPFTRQPAEAEEAWDEAGRRGLVLMEAVMWRHSPHARMLSELLPRIGSLQAITAAFSFRLTQEANVRLDRDLGGGALLDVGCYCVSGARLIAGREPDRVYGEWSVGRGGVDEGFAGVMRFGEVLATFQCGFRADQRGLTAIGSDGVLHVPDPWLATRRYVLLNGEEHPVEDISSYRLELENFCAAIRGEAEPLLGRADAVGQARTLAALWRSAESRAPVTLAD